MPIDKVVNGKEVTFYAYDEPGGGPHKGCTGCPVRTACLADNLSSECLGGFLRPRRRKQPAGDPVEVQTFGPLRRSTLPTDSDERKGVPVYSGVVAYFPAALAGVARISKAGNDKHNPGQPLHHARGKSMDHADCILRHMIDLADLLAEIDRAKPGEAKPVEQALAEVSNLAWRALAYSQQLHEKLGGAPLAPGAKE